MRFDEGYLLLATGSARYVEMARNLAASLRVMDSTRRVCLVHDDSHVHALGDHAFFDDYAVLKNDPLYPSFMNKIHLYAASPYGRAMFVDADEGYSGAGQRDEPASRRRHND